MEALMSFGIQGPKGDTGPQGPKGDVAMISMASKISVVPNNTTKTYTQSNVIAICLPSILSNNSGIGVIGWICVSPPGTGEWNSYSSYGNSQVVCHDGITSVTQSSLYVNACAIVFLK